MSEMGKKPIGSRRKSKAKLSETQVDVAADDVDPPVEKQFDDPVKTEPFERAVPDENEQVEQLLQQQDSQVKAVAEEEKVKMTLVPEELAAVASVSPRRTQECTVSSLKVVDERAQSEHPLRRSDPTSGRPKHRGRHRGSNRNSKAKKASAPIWNNPSRPWDHIRALFTNPPPAGPPPPPPDNKDKSSGESDFDELSYLIPQVLLTHSMTSILTCSYMYI